MDRISLNERLAEKVATKGDRQIAWWIAFCFLMVGLSWLALIITVKICGAI